MKVLFIGGTGQISYDCIHESVCAGHETWVFNRGNNNAGLPAKTHLIKDDITEDPEWIGPLFGDKAYSVTFDNSKIKSVVGDFQCKTSLDEFMKIIAGIFFKSGGNEREMNPGINEIFDKMAEDQKALG